MLLKIENLKFSYPSNNNYRFEIKIKDWGVDIGSFVTLLGPNGSGKSTLLKLIIRILNYNSGSIKFRNKELSSISRKELSKMIAYVPQSIVTIFPYSVYEFVMMGRTPYLNFMGFEKEEDKKIVNEILDILEISHLRKKGINEISGGELQRVVIAKALAQNPEFILLDEPNAHLDLEHQISTFDLLKKLKDEKKLTILAVTHDLNLAGIYADEVAFILNGQIIESGSKSELLKEENIKNVFNINTKVYKSEKDNVFNVLINPI
ncbi:MAG: ABC transporter ATP-binding protein [Melioribacter sp.]|nr:ABC transporter ATP-binding protein [Melioribacter sp.]